MKHRPDERQRRKALKFTGEEPTNGVRDETYGSGAYVEYAGVFDQDAELIAQNLGWD